ncbi:hypothetical protein E8E13_005768 [Curvularia kusanoi]|uniref:Uncharacterized protein n=1 Tax=Curvularia kusanoi TaxID=90978 RepID=A0A9P4TLV3_CURKU|nr:hypothetical protein E8E13_005768 [Curvularia kusanoi]
MSTQTKTFFDGWRTLPKELQIEILSYVVLVDPSRGGLISAHRLPEARYWNSHSPFLDVIAPLLACAEIKDVVVEEFYKQNRFLISFEEAETTPNMAMHLPLAPLRRFIRRIHVSLGTWTEDKIRLLTEASRATVKLDNLMYLDISFGYKGNVKIGDVPVLRFESKCLRVTFQHYDKPSLAMVLLDKFELGDAAEQPETTWTRQILSVDEDTPDFTMLVEDEEHWREDQRAFRDDLKSGVV